jgi:hypothetical protein
MKLEGKKLEVINIHRQSLIDANYVGVCENCGKIIVNVATVKDIDTNEKFEIGLDCKKTLIDKKYIDKIKIDFPSEWDNKYKIKEYKQMQSCAEKFLVMSSNPNNEIKINNNEILIYDNLPNKNFPQVNGNIIFMESIGYLKRIGLLDFINELGKKSKISRL